MDRVTKLVGDGSSYLDIETYDSDGDSVALSVEDDAGGTIELNANRLTASFADGNVSHTIKIGLSDGKEKIIKEFTVIDFSQNSIENFYSDVTTTHPYFHAIAFATLKGVIAGQVSPTDDTQRIFRPDDNVSLAEALAMVINAEQKAGLVELQTVEYYRKTFPSWAMPYYTYAVDSGALSSQMGNLAYIYPTRETIAQLIVKTLDLESKVYLLGNNISFTDEADFTDVSMLQYAKIVKAFGLFMLEERAKPQERISRAELAMVIEKIFMIPSATLSVAPTTIEYGDTITASLNNVQAEAINSTNYSLYDASSQLQATYMADGKVVTNPIDSHILSSTLSSLYAILDNNGVKNIVTTALNINYTDSDNDGLQDRVDKWIGDIRYAYDENNNSIPDILDSIYNLADKTANSIVSIDGNSVSIADIIRDGGWFLDTDGDGISDIYDPDIDGDGVVNVQDAFPNDATESVDSDGDGVGDNADAFPNDDTETIDTDGDGIGDNTDTDDDGDGIDDDTEISVGLNPLDASDGGGNPIDCREIGLLNHQGETFVRFEKCIEPSSGDIQSEPLLKDAQCDDDNLILRQGTTQCDVADKVKVPLRPLPSRVSCNPDTHYIVQSTQECVER